MANDTLYYGNNLDSFLRHVQVETGDRVNSDLSPGRTQHTNGLFANRCSTWAARLTFVVVTFAGCSHEEPIYEGRPVSDWARTLKDEDPSARSAAANALAEIGAEAKNAVPELVRVLKTDPEDFVRVNAAESLGRIGPAAMAGVPALTQALNSENAAIRAAAADALGKMGAEAKSATTTLLGVRARDLDDHVRRRAGDALEKIQTAKKETHWPLFYISSTVALIGLLLAAAAWARRTFNRFRVHSLVKELKHHSPAVRQRAARSLGSAGSAAEAAIPSLIEALKGEDNLLRTYAQQALAKIGISSHHEIAELVLALRHENPLERVRAVVTLGVMGSKAEVAVPALIEAVGDKNISVRREAIEALGNIGPKARSAVPCLREALRENDYALHRATTIALRRIGI